MSFDTALGLTLLGTVFVLACTMANLLARITRLERFAGQFASGTLPNPGHADAGPVPVPEKLALLLKGRDRARLLFLSSDCSACDEALAQVEQWPEEARRASFLLYRDEPPRDFVAPPAVRVVPRADELFEILSVGSTPTFMHAEGGVIVGRTTGFMVTSTPPPQADASVQERRSA